MDGVEEDGFRVVACGGRTTAFWGDGRAEGVWHDVVRVRTESRRVFVSPEGLIRRMDETEGKRTVWSIDVPPIVTVVGLFGMVMATGTGGAVKRGVVVGDARQDPICTTSRQIIASGTGSR